MKACGVFDQYRLANKEDNQMDDHHGSSPEKAYTDELQQFMIMPRLGQNLENYFETIKCQLPEISIYSLAIKMISLLECVHKIGVVFNDLKLDNLMVEANDQLPDP